MCTMSSIVTLWIVILLTSTGVHGGEIHVSPIGAVFSQTDETILIGPSSDNIILHLAMEIPKLDTKYDDNCNNKYQTTRAYILTTVSC